MDKQVADKQVVHIEVGHSMAADNMAVDNMVYKLEVAHNMAEQDKHNIQNDDVDMCRGDDNVEHLQQMKTAPEQPLQKRLHFS